MTDPTPEPTPKEKRLEELRAYLVALKAKRLELLTGAQSYSVGSRSLARYSLDLQELNAEIKRTEKDIFLTENDMKDAKMVPVVFHDFF